MKRFFCLLLMAVMTMTCMTFASAESLIAEDFTVTFMRAENAAIPVQADVASTREIKEKTGVNLEIITAPGSDYSTKMTALYASNDMPDIFMAFSMTKREMVEDGALLCLTDLIEEYAPNIKAFYEENPSLYRTMVDGEIYSLAQKRSDQNLEAGCVPFIRMDILEDSGLPIPTTWEELGGDADPALRNVRYGRLGGPRHWPHYRRR